MATRSRRAVSTLLNSGPSTSRLAPRPFSSTPISSLPSSSSSSSPSSQPPRAYPDLISPETAFGNLSIPSSSFVPRGPRFPSPSAPQHRHINFPDRIFLRPSQAYGETSSSSRSDSDSFGGGGDQDGFGTMDDQTRKQLGFPEQFAGIGGGQRLKMEVLSAQTGLTADEVRGLNRYTVVLKRVVNMTKKGKMPSFFTAVVVGSPSRGLVGMGQGRGDTAPAAMDKGWHQAVLSMDHVTRFENRTTWGAGKELSAKFGATTVILRGRPAGFGLAVPPVLHRILTACGIKDCSATIEGSRNPMHVLKAGLQILHGGAALPNMSNGSGHKAPRANKGYGMRSRQEIERERGRWGVEVGRKL